MSRHCRGRCRCHHRGHDGEGPGNIESFFGNANAYRIPIALQWMFPTPLAILLFIAPESPWWLTRKGRYEQAARSIERLGRRSRVNSTEGVAMMRRVIAKESDASPNLIELFKGTDLRRTLIVCGVYAAQNLAGNLIANQAVFFFERESIRPYFRHLLSI